MRYLVFLLLPTLLVVSCCKDKIDDPDDMNVPGLPPVTETGQNTFGCLVNGKPWTPAGPNNLSIDYDPGFNNGIVGIVAYRRIFNGDNSVVSFGIQDSLNFLRSPTIIQIKPKALAQVSFGDSSFCERSHYDPLVFRNGVFTLTKYDKVLRVFAGTFEVTLFNPACGDTIRITKGRFDMKF